MVVHPFFQLLAHSLNQQNSLFGYHVIVLFFVPIPPNMIDNFSKKQD